jgi:hypothetical protein
LKDSAVRKFNKPKAIRFILLKSIFLFKCLQNKIYETGTAEAIEAEEGLWN